MQSLSMKEEARRIVDGLSEEATWDELMEAIYARQAIEQGLRDSHAERTHSLDDVRAKFGLEP